jgi:type II restriction enzyme
MKNKKQWTESVRAIVAGLPTNFPTKAVYAAGEKKLSRQHPENNNVRAKIRQQLQRLRDNGELQSDERGWWRKA